MICVHFVTMDNWNTMMPSQARFYHWPISLESWNAKLKRSWKEYLVQTPYFIVEELKPQKEVVCPNYTSSWWQHQKRLVSKFLLQKHQLKKIINYIAFQYNVPLWDGDREWFRSIYYVEMSLKKKYYRDQWGSWREQAASRILRYLYFIVL